jgi:ribose-phosphate pyrophosphokinase
MTTARGALKLFTGNGSVELARKVAEQLRVPVSDALVGAWSNGETRVQLNENVRGADVFILQSFGTSVNDRVMELLLMLDAAKRASASRITAVVPYYPYSTQERKVRAREPISARVFADLMVHCGADRALTIELHAGAIQSFFGVPVDHLPILPIAAKHLRERGIGGPDWVVVAPDEGAVDRSGKLADALGSDVAVIFKRHPEEAPEEVETVEVVGEFEGKRALIHDDIIFRGSTLVNAAGIVMNRGATEVHAFVTHGVLCGDGPRTIRDSALAGLILTDTVPLRIDPKEYRIHVMTVAPFLAEAIGRIHEDASVSEMLH